MKWKTKNMTMDYEDHEDKKPSQELWHMLHYDDDVNDAVGDDGMNDVKDFYEEKAPRQ